MLNSPDRSLEAETLSLKFKSTKCPYFETPNYCTNDISYWDAFTILRIVFLFVLAQLLILCESGVYRRLSNSKAIFIRVLKWSLSMIYLGWLHSVSLGVSYQNIRVTAGANIKFSYGCCEVFGKTTDPGQSGSDLSTVH